jgi:arylsulfatase A-like enzyme
MRSRPAGGPSAWAATILAALLAGCGRRAQAPAAGGEVLWVLDRAAEGRLEYPQGGGSGRTLLAGAELSRADWRAFADLRGTASAEESTALGAQWSLEPGGALRLTAPKLALVHLLPLGAEETWIEASAQLSAEGLDGQLEHGYTRFGLFQFGLDRLPEDPQEVLAALVADHFALPLLESTTEPQESRVSFARDPRARSLLVVLEQVAAEGRASRAVFDQVVVRTAGAHGRALARAEEFDDAAPAVGWPADRPRLGRYAADLVHRPGVAVPLWAAAWIPVDGRGARRRFEAQVAVLGEESAGTVRCRVSWSGGAGEPRPVAELELPLEVDGDPATAPAGWTVLRGELPADAEDSGALVLTAEGGSGAAGDWVPVFAGALLRGPEPARREPRPNVLLVSLDTVRADRLGAYGCARPTSPHFDAFAAGGQFFGDVWAPAPYTLPSHVSLFSGQLPSVHDVQRSSQRRDRVRTPLLAERLRAAGYRTAAYTGGAMVLPHFGFAAGFERYGVLDPWLNRSSDRTARLLAGLPGVGPRAYAATGLEAIEAELRAFGTDPWFLFAHTYAAHEFDPPPQDLERLGTAEGLPADDPDVLRYLANGEPPPEPIRRRLNELYEGGVSFADRFLGELLALVEELGQGEQTLVVVTSDHGKEIGEHGVVGHGHRLYEELLRIPLALRVPGRAPARSDRPAQLVDVLPTLLRQLQLEVPADLQGRDLFGPAGEGADRLLWAELRGVRSLAALRRGASKTILERGEPDRVEHFDLARDPGETEPLAPDAEALARLLAFQESLDALRAALPAERRERRPMDEAARAHLEALGYRLGADD